MKIKFCGAATGVTGSCHLISTDHHKILLDCGQFQGGEEEEDLNLEPFPFNPAEIECVVASHAHIDHIGRLPLLVKQGFKGIIYCTYATADLMKIMLADSAHIHEQDAEWKNRKGKRAGLPPIEPLYTTEDAQKTLKHVRPVLYDTLVSVNDQMKIVFNDAGHILGSAIIELWVEENNRTRKIVFSGDLGMQDRPILHDPVVIHKADCVIMETTYGNRLHEKNAESIERLRDIIVETTQRGGNVIIPSFAVGRTQELIFELNRIYDGDSKFKELLKDVHVYIDSPMAAETTKVFRNNAQVYDEETLQFIMRGDHPLDFPNLHFTKTVEESMMINVDTKPKIIISASGMCTAGRIRHHLKHYLYKPQASIVFVGFQAEGTLGRILIEGTDKVKLFGETIAVKAQIHSLEGFSGHADRDALYSWLCGFTNEPHDIFLVHGEMDAKREFAAYVKEHNGWKCEVVDGFNEYELLEETRRLTEKQSADDSFRGSSEADRDAADKKQEPETGNDFVDKEPVPQVDMDNEGKDPGIAPAGDSAEKEFTSEEELKDLIGRIDGMHDVVDKILSNASNTVEGSTSTEKLTRIKNLVASLEKDIVNLGSAVSEEDRTEGEDLHLDGVLPEEDH